ncbi:apolipoprotein N-acyltransferase [Arcobacter sp. LA11]|uniref:apolipoprotein N-acyltransferase n=1 Tax=Arcobacter sp. LA11 TaxID=1898176 RepID=UPI0009330FEE|nr:apolipoprotein N-acyltransferase [Arcobacter sp. LA11]
MFLVKRDNFNKIYIIKGLMTALLLSAFIYLAYFDIEYKLLNTILGLVSLYLLLKIERPALFFTGFFTGVLWFYWVGISFQYYDLTVLGPLIVLAFGLGYGLIFLLIAIYDKIFFRIIIIFLLSYIQPFGFNWFIPELIFIDSYLPTSKEYFALILASIFMFTQLNKKLKVLALVPLYIISSNTSSNINNPNIKISMPQLNVSQEQKWVKNNISNILEENLKHIDTAIQKGNELIILPETVFPVLLNKENFLMHQLEEKSREIDIIAGALYLENKQYYNATFHFSKGKLNVAKKVVLVPFGEEIPLPKFFVDLINDTFYNGAQDYTKAKKPTDFNIYGTKFRNAICYEATSEEIYQNLGDVKYMIATSNNAWFTPSIEPTLQKLILKYYARKYDVTIFHSINGSENYIVRP